jgi:hypothetical protein
MHPRAMQRLGPAMVTILIGGSGCGDALPLRERIASTRPLALRVEVIDPSADPEAPVRAEALPTERVRLVPFIVDEHGPLDVEVLERDVEPVWLACPLRPVEGLFACLSAAIPSSPDEILECPEPTLPSSETIDELPDFPAPCRITGGTPARPELIVPLDPSFLIGGDLEVTMIGHVPGAGSTRACLEQLLEGSDAFSEDCIFVTQRVPVGPEALLGRLAVDLGLVSPEQIGPIPETIPEPDAHPRIIAFSVVAHDAAGVELGRFDVSRGDVLELPAGARLEIETEAPASDLQTYLVPRDRETFVEREEVYRGQWFRTWGTLLSPSSNDPVSFNEWTLEPGPQDEPDGSAAGPDSGRATLYYVLRDSRQGVDWWWFHVDVTEEP